MAKVKLLFTQTRYDQNNMWLATKTLEVDLPDWVDDKYDHFKWQLVGMERIEDEPEDNA